MKIKFGSILVRGAVTGLILGTILWLAASALLVVIPTLPAVTPLALWIIGFVGPIAIDISYDIDRTAEQEPLEEKK